MNKENTCYVKHRGETKELTFPLVMGIVNVTPDSFFVGSRVRTPSQVLTRVKQIFADGGTIIDVGACSTRPGSMPIDERSELRRLNLSLRTIRREFPDAIISVDTFRPRLARICVKEYGVNIINDVSGGNEEMFEAVGDLGVTYILTSTEPTMQKMKREFRKKIKQLADYGCHDVWLDPGYGFGKEIFQNYDILRRQKELLSFGKPLLVGVSRKRMAWQLLGVSPEKALNGTSVLNTLCLERGAQILRVHDVKEAMEVIKLVDVCF